MTKITIKNSDSPSFHVPKSLTLTEIKKAKIKQLGFELHYSNTLQSNQVEIEFNPSVYAQILKKSKSTRCFNYRSIRAIKSSRIIL